MEKTHLCCWWVPFRPWREYTFNSICTSDFSSVAVKRSLLLVRLIKQQELHFSLKMRADLTRCASLCPSGSLWRLQPVGVGPDQAGPRGGPSGAALTSTFPHLKTATPAAGLRAAERLIMEHVPIDVASLHQKKETCTSRARSQPEDSFWRFWDNSRRSWRAWPIPHGGYIRLILVFLHTEGHPLRNRRIEDIKDTLKQPALILLAHGQLADLRLLRSQGRRRPFLG